MALLCLSSSESLSLCLRAPLTVPSVSRRWGSAGWTRVLISALEQGRRSERGGPVAWTRPESRHCPADTHSLCCQSCHEGQCPFMLTECPACKGLVRLGEKEHHLEHQCPERSLSCRHCRAPCSPADMKVSAPGRHAGLRLPPLASWHPDGPAPSLWMPPACRARALTAAVPLAGAPPDLPQVPLDVRRLRQEEDRP